VEEPSFEGPCQTLRGRVSAVGTVGGVVVPPL
jgi:hypothetical protein